MDLGHLELAVLAAVRALGEATPGEIHREVRRTRDIAYTSVTTTLYRLVDKDLVATRRASSKRVFYRIREGRAHRQALARMVGRLVDSFGSAAVSHLLERPDDLSETERHGLEAKASERRRAE
jgi:predicted transcriptional regulator